MIVSGFILLALAKQVYATQVCSPNSGPIFKDVVIVGAGAAGLAAASRLEEVTNGGVSYALLEATNNVGGRVQTQTLDFGGFSGNWVVEDAANWIYDFPGNPIMSMVQEYGLVIAQQDFFDFDAYDASGQSIPERDLSKMRRNWDAAWKCVQQESSSPYTSGDGIFAYDIGALSLLEYCGWERIGPEEKDNLRYFLQWYYLQYEYADSDTSLTSFPEDVFGTPTFIVVDQNGGYQGMLMRYAMDKIPIENTFLEHEVQLIDYASPPSNYPDYRASVIVQEKNGDCKKFLTKRVISTVSTGVLHERSGDLFSPPLDMTLNPFTMQQYIKIFYQFENKFWGDEEFIVTLRDVPDRGMCHQWQNLDTVGKNGRTSTGKKGTTQEFLVGSNILMCTLITEEFFQVADPTTKTLSAVTISELLQPLRDAFSNFEEPIDSYYPDLPNDKFLGQGAYSNWKPDPNKTWGESMVNYFSFYGGNGCPYCGADDSFYQAVNGYQGDEWILHISGSASCFEHLEFVHGGIFAGKRSANYVLSDFGYPVSTYSECEDF